MKKIGDILANAFKSLTMTMIIFVYATWCNEGTVTDWTIKIIEVRSEYLTERVGTYNGNSTTSSLYLS